MTPDQALDIAEEVRKQDTYTEVDLALLTLADAFRHQGKQPFFQFAPAPEKASDWVGKKVLTRIALESNLVSIPANTVMVIEQVGPVKHLRRIQCPCCGFAPKIGIAVTDDNFLTLVDFLSEQP